MSTRLTAEAKQVLIDLAEHVAKSGGFPQRAQFFIEQRNRTEAFDFLEKERLLVQWFGITLWTIAGLKAIAAEDERATQELGVGKLVLKTLQSMYVSSQTQEHPLADLHEELRNVGLNDVRRGLAVLQDLPIFHTLSVWSLAGPERFGLREDILRVNAEEVFLLEPANVPVFQNYMNPLLEVLREAGQPLAIESLDRSVAARMQLSEETIAFPHDPEKPDRSEVSYRIAWARTYLKKVGLIDNPRRGVWTVTDQGRNAGEVDARALASEVGQSDRSGSDGDDSGSVSTSVGVVPDDEELVVGRVADPLAREIRRTYGMLVADGSIPLRQDVEKLYAVFRDRFGPAVLSSLDGEALLLKMHGRGTGDSLVHWLEFKNDSEFPALFGSIGGASALKFGLYFAKDGQRWMTGPPQQMRPLDVVEAVEIARKQRDQLVAGTQIVEQFTAQMQSVDFAQLQKRLVEVAPDVAESAWGHKYLSVMAPNLVEPFHSVEYQGHQLRKLLKLPTGGRYENARIFVGVAAQLGITLFDLCTTLMRLNGAPYGYWRVGTTVDGTSEWPRMRDGGFAAIGWSELGSLVELPRNESGRTRARELIAKQYPSGLAAVVTRSANQLFQFVTKIQERDLVLAMEGVKVHGIGRVTGSYYFQDGDGPFAHRVPVEWLHVGDWKFPKAEGLQRTVHLLGKYPINLVEAEGRLVAARQSTGTSQRPPATQCVAAPPPPLEGLLARIQSVLQRKKQVILYGPPGTGKTYWAERAVRELAARSWFERTYTDLAPTERDALHSDGAVAMCTFHPAYGYEDFLEGYRPSTGGGPQIQFQLQDGVFKELCSRAAQQPKRNFYLIVDEINRGDVPRIFGELLTVLENDKRGKLVVLPLSRAKFSVPENVFVVGTMNTADRSIALLDTALRRRFGFVEIQPDAAALGDASVGGIALGPWLTELNRRIVRDTGRDARNLQIGHAYLMANGSSVTDFARFAEVLRDEIIPLLEEYCYEDFGALERILGRVIVLDRQRINANLFDVARLDELADALRAQFPEIALTARAVTAQAAEEAARADLADSDAEEEEDDFPAGASPHDTGELSTTNAAHAARSNPTG